MEAELIRHEGWAELVMNRPERKNAITGPLGIAMAESLAAVNDDESIQVLVLRGAGGAFCSGLDLKEFNADPAPDWLPDFQKIWRGAHRALFECRVPIIGAMERYAINGGAALALACDLLIVGRESFLQVGEVQIGMAAPYNMAWLALRHPEAVAARLAMIGRRHNGAALLSMGIAYDCVDDADVLSAAAELATAMSEYPARSSRKIKAGIRANLIETADDWFDRFTNVHPVGTPAPTRMK